jgi:exodeoxyribonuclease V gamma subunit
MPGLIIFTSNRMEALVERLAEVLRAPLASAMTPEIIMVQSRGMERWVSMELARLNGICANIRFPFPKAFLEELLCRGAPAADPPAFDRDAVAFRLMKILPTHLLQPEFEGLNSYLRQDHQRRNLFQLCRKLADLFDQYAVFRPDMLLRWEEGRVEADSAHRWQARLWCELLGENPNVNHPRRQSVWYADPSGGGISHDTLPERVSVFGISYLPPVYLRSFAVLARRIPVNLFFLNPCRAYWADIVSEKEIRRLEKRLPQSDAAAEALHLDRGNRLLASLGTVGREFFEMISEFGAESIEQFEAPPGSSLLARVQTDILELIDRERQPSETPTSSPAAADGSIQIHSCHSPMREIEVLHDRLLAFFEEDSQLRPTDIVVMAPDIAAMASYISAVFGSQLDPQRQIPYSIADRGTAGENSLQSALFALLDLKNSRLGAGEILRLLEYPAIREAFGLAEAQLPLIERWVRQTGIRWGEDGRRRAALNLPGDEHNTWKTGIERLLLGYALPARGLHLFQGVLAFDAMEGGETRFLGDFLEFLTRVFELARTLEEPETLSAWSQTLRAVLADFFQLEGALASDARRVERVLTELAGLQESTGYDEPVGLEVVRSFLSERLETGRLGFGFLSGGVTFCAMLPMRSIPFKVVCLIGMNHDAFPREHYAPVFDLMARHPRRGDRSRRNDDKYLFLEALLSARHSLYISYVGQNIQDNSRQPPSVLVSELIDVLLKGYGLPDDPAHGGLITEHRLQAFSGDYFKAGSKLFSYSQEDLLACSAAAERRKAGALFRQPLPLPADEAPRWRELSLEGLEDFFLHPARFIVRQRLGIRFEEDSGAPEEREPFELDPLTRYRMGQAMLATLRDGGDPARLFEVTRAAGEIPHGSAGELLFRRLQADVEVFFRKAGRFLPREAETARDGDWSANGFRLSGRIFGMYSRGCLLMRFADVGARDFIKAWIRHLFLGCIADSPSAPQTLLIGKDAVWSFGGVKEPAAVLQLLLAMYWQGLGAPLRFFPRSSLAFFRQRSQKKDDERQALAAARRQWIGSEHFPGESNDLYYRLCFDPADALDPEFQRLAIQVFEPMFAHAAQLQ